MYVVRDKDGMLKLFNSKPMRNWSWVDCYQIDKREFWTRDTKKFPLISQWSKTGVYDPDYQITYLDSSLFPELKWEDEPLEVELIIKNK